SVSERLLSFSRSQTLFGNACSRSLVPKLCLGTPALETLFREVQARETEFRGNAFPNRVWERGANFQFAFSFIDRSLAWHTIEFRSLGVSAFGRAESRPWDLIRFIPAWESEISF